MVAIHALDLDDAALVRAVQQGDSEAFAGLFDRHYDHVRRVCGRRLNNPVEADEVAQAAFVRAFERIHQCTGDRRFGAWVQVIAGRLCADTWRAMARTTPVDEPLAGEAGLGRDECEEAVLRNEQAAAVHQALATLPSRQREVIIARDVEGRRPSEIAAALAVSVGAVDSLLLRARRRMVLAYRAASPEQGAASASVSTASVAAGSAVAGPLSRTVESLSAVFHAGVANLASVLGFAPPAPAMVQRVVGGVVAGALLVAPLAAVDDPLGPAARVPAPPASLPGVGDAPDVHLGAVVATPAAPPTPDVAGGAAQATAGLPAAPVEPDGLGEVAPPPAAAPPSPPPAVVVGVPAALNEVAAVVAEAEGAATAAVHQVDAALAGLLAAPRLR